MKLLTVLLLILSAIPAMAQVESTSITEDTWQFLMSVKWSKGQQRLADIKDPNTRIAIGYRRVLTEEISPQQFYREMATLDLGGKELRTKMVEVKTTLISTLGTKAAEHFFGEIYVKQQSDLATPPEGNNPKPKLGSQVEDMILTWRSEVYDRVKQRTLERVAAEFAGKQRRHSLFVADLGSRPSGQGEATVAGDLDGDFITADTEMGLRALEIWDEEMRGVTGGLNGVDIDLVATYLGMSGPEVYAGEAGRIKVVEMILDGKVQNVQRVDPDTGRILGEVAGREALRQVAIEGGLEGIEIPETGEVKLPAAGPAVIFEMARHLDRDVLRNLQFEDMESFLKTAKFVERASGEAARAGHPIDSDLVQFSKGLVAAKSDGDYVRASKLITDYFGSDMPLDVELGRTEGPKPPLTIKANREFVRQFAEKCRDALMTSGKDYLADEIKTMNERVRGLTGGSESPKAVAEDLAKLREDMEVEKLVLEHPKHGLRDMDPEVVRMIDELHTTNKTLMRDNWRDVLPEHLKQQRVFIENILRKDGELNRGLAAATIAHTPDNALARGLEFVDGVNNLMDSLDDSLLGPLRGEVDFMSKIVKGHEISYATRAASFFNVEVGDFLEIEMSGGMRSFLSDLEVFNTGIEIKVNTFFFDNCVAKRIQQTNKAFGETLQSSSVASAGMNAIGKIQLASELVDYWKAFDQESWEEGFSQLATAFFENRVPAGSAAKHWVMGNTGLACWDLFTAIFPPAAMAYGAYGLADAMAAKSSDYWWSRELELFADELYASATWEITGVKRVGDNIDLEQWKLKTVTYNGTKILIDEYLALKREHIADMEAAMKVPFERRRFPTGHTAFDPFLGWFGAGNLLRENLSRTDNVLLVLDEELKNPHVGGKLETQLRQKWNIRWEKVKVAYLERLVDQLERRSGAEALGSHRLAEVLLELYAVTGELRIADQAFAALEKESGFTQLSGWMSWFKDVVIAGKRAVLEQAANETAFAKAHRISLAYLEVYTDIRDARATTEEAFVPGGKAAEESGLRIMTTPFLLSGNANRDMAATPKWAGLPVAKGEKIAAELTAIKRAFVPGGRLDPSADSFDQRILRGMIYHDVFKEIWKKVQTTTSVTQGSVTNLSFAMWWEIYKQRYLGDNEQAHGYADSALDFATGANEIDGLGSADIPLDRFRHHDAERDGLALEFLEHYLTGDDRLVGLVNRAEELSRQIKEHCELAEAEIDAVRTGAETLSAHADGLIRSLTAVEDRFDRVGALLDTIGRHHADAETAATAVAEAATEAERLRLEICNRLKQAKSSTNPEILRQIITEMEGLHEQLAFEVEIGDDGFWAVEEAARNARTAFSDVESVIAEIGLIDEAAQSVGDGSKLGDRLEIASENLAEIPPLIDELREVRREAVDTLGAVTGALERFTEADDTIAIGARVETAVERVVDLAEQAEGTDRMPSCHETVSRDFDEVTLDLDDARADLNVANQELANSVNAASALDDRVDRARRDTEGAEYLVELSGSYQELLQTAAEGARLCLDRAHDLFSQGTVPDVVGRSLDEARGILTNSGLRSSMQGGDPAPSADLAFAVESQTPGAGEPVPESGVVALRVWGPTGTITVPAVTGMVAAGARSAIEDAGLVASFVAGGAAPSPAEAFTVEAQQPAAGAQTDRGDTVTVTIHGAFDVAAATQGVDCSAWAGTIAVWDQASNTPKCECPQQTSWSGTEGRCVSSAAIATAAVPQRSDPCAERDEAFWQLMTAQRFDQARNVLLQSQNCDFYSRGVAALQSELDEICRRISRQVLQACAQGNLGRAQALIMEARRQRCRVSTEAYRCIDRAQRAEHQQRTQQEWAQLFGVVNQIAQDIQRESNRDQRSGSGTTIYQPPPRTNSGPSLSDIDIGGIQTAHPPGGGGTSGGGTRGGGGGTSGGSGGRSYEECEKQYCSMCGDDVDLLGVSVDSQCNECRNVNSANINACMEGRAAGPAVATTATYRLVCVRHSQGTEGCNSYNCLEPSDVKGPYDVVVGAYQSWDQCYQQSTMYTGR